MAYITRPSRRSTGHRDEFVEDGPGRIEFVTADLEFGSGDWLVGGYNMLYRTCVANKWCVLF